jgi:hypothetical protein
MKHRDLISALFWMIFGGAFAIGGLMQGLVRQGIPGPGSMPFIVGLITVGLAGILLVQALWTKAGPREKFFPQPESLRKLSLALLGIFAYGLLLKTLGFTLTTFVFLVFVLRFIGYEKWSTVWLFSLGTALLSYLLFTSLQVELPKGFVGI